MKHKTLKILVGDKLQLEKVGSNTGERYSSTVIGFVPGKSLLVTTPVVNDKSILIMNGQQFAVRMLQGSHIQAFVSKVLHNALVPYSYMHLSFPQEVEYIEVRNAERVDTNIPVLVRGIKLPDEKDNWKPASIKDISSSGAKLESISKIGEDDDELIMKLKLSICSREEEMELKIKVMHLEDQSKTGADEWKLYAYGVQFIKPSRLEQALIHIYVLEQRISFNV